MKFSSRLPATAALRAVLAAVLVTSLVSCGGPPKQRDFDQLYRGLSESLPRIDPSILEGRRILIDPGHGGYFAGTVGPDSLEESSVNLGVSLYLWGLFNEAGADAHLTRSVDRDFLGPEDSSLASDLRSRVAIADSLEPDVLISIHHNAQPKRDPDKNSVETYYRAGDPASLDLAIAVHRHLMRNLGIDTGEVRQGNYLILRESSCPAVLGESSYLTHPPTEEKLKLSKVQKLEAEAYFLGILEYFERGIPRVRCLSPEDSLYESVPALIYELEDDGGTGIDPDGVSMTLNGHAVQPMIDERVSRVTYRMPWDSPNGCYEAAVSARNVGGNTSPIHSVRFTIDFPPELAVFEFTPERLPPRGGYVRARVRLLDRRGLTVRDGEDAFVAFSSSVDTVWTKVVDGSIEAMVRTLATSQPGTVDVGCRGRRFQTTIDVDPDTQLSSRAYFVRDAVTGLPIDGAVVRPPGTSSGSMTSNGIYIDVDAYRNEPDSLALDLSNSGWSVSAPGYVPAGLGSGHQSQPPDTIDMTPWFGGALNKRRFVIDPEGGKASVAGIGPLGLSGPFANLRVARYLESFLEAAGARVRLTRANEEVRTPEDIARTTNRFQADRYIEIRHRNTTEDSLVVTTYHFPGSAKGENMAESVLEEMSNRLRLPSRGPFDTVTYPLQQTACPAIVVEAPSIGILEEELRLAESWYQREQAYAIFLGVLRHYGVADSGAVFVSVEGDDAAGWRVTLDDTWTLISGENGTVVFEALAAGPHRISFFKSGRLYHDVVEVTPYEPARLSFTPPVE